MAKEVKRTKKNHTEARITDAFFQLYKGKPIDKISIKEIVSLAGCHRSTFYEYFDDIYDILHREEAALFKMQQERVLNPILSGEINITATKELLPILLGIFHEKGDRLVAFFGEHGDPYFQQQFKKNIVTTICKFLDIDKEDKESLYLMEFTTSGIIAVVSRLNAENDIGLNDLMNFFHPRIVAFVLG